jgi:hypothetical protein
VEGEKWYYLCQIEKSCLKTCYLLFPVASTFIHLYVCNKDHFHESNNVKNMRVLTKQKILQLLSQKKNNKEILKAIEKDNLLKLTGKQLTNFKYYAKKKLDLVND